MDATSPQPPFLANQLANMATGERPQERLQKHGAGALSDTELLAMLLRSGTRGKDVVTLAGQLIAQAGSLADLIKWTSNDFERHKGIGRIKALQLVTVMEVARRVMQRNQNEDPKLDEPAAIAEYCRPECLGLGVEKFWVLCLNRRNRLIRRVEVTAGTDGSTLMHPREVFREAIKEASTTVVCVHSHSSGDPACCRHSRHPHAANCSADRGYFPAGSRNRRRDPSRSDRTGFL